MDKERPSPLNEMWMGSVGLGGRSLYSHTVCNPFFHFREFFSYKFALSMFPNQEEVFPSLETKDSKRIKKNFTALPPRID